MDTLLALDLGAKTGWALRMRDGTIMHGARNFKSVNADGAGMVFLRFKRWLDDLAGDRCPAQVWFEDVKRHIGTAPAHAFGGFRAVLAMWCETNQIPYEGVGVSEVKKHATGRGNASKDMVLAAMREKGFEPVDDNAADALAVLHLAIAKEG
ncbi:MAG: hypothetical protein HQL87_09810 [Magnetococcales bacterium]|nr:hypothetical protein [Magnetococcales bacterium]